MERRRRRAGPVAGARPHLSRRSILPANPPDGRQRQPARLCLGVGCALASGPGRTRAGSDPDRGRQSALCVGAVGYCVRCGGEDGPSDLALRPRPRRQLRPPPLLRRGEPRALGVGGQGLPSPRSTARWWHSTPRRAPSCGRPTPSRIARPGSTPSLARPSSPTTWSWSVTVERISGCADTSRPTISRRASEDGGSTPSPATRPRARPRTPAMELALDTWGPRDGLGLGSRWNGVGRDELRPRSRPPVCRHRQQHSVRRLAPRSLGRRQSLPGVDPRDPPR